MNQNTAFITRVTSRIGRAIAQLFAQNKLRLIQLKEELSNLTDVITLQFDVRQKHVVNTLNTILGIFNLS